MEKCNFCGAEKVLNPHTGKMFCKEKCWLKKSNDNKTKSVVNEWSNDYKFQQAVMDEFGAINKRLDALAEYLVKTLGKKSG